MPSLIWYLFGIKRPEIFLWLWDKFPPLIKIITFLAPAINLYSLLNRLLKRVSLSFSFLNRKEMENQRKQLLMLTCGLNLKHIGLSLYTYWETERNRCEHISLFGGFVDYMLNKILVFTIDDLEHINISICVP